MNITREDLVKRLSEESGYYQKDVREVLKSLDNVVLNCFAEADDNEEVLIQLIEGLKIGVKIMPCRERINPKNQQPIVCSETVKPFTKWSNLFRQKIQQNYENKKG